MLPGSFHSCYAFRRAHRGCRGKLWASVVAELRCFRALLLIMGSVWRPQWNGRVTATDASDTGCGVATAAWPVAEVARCGRLAERTRFRRKDFTGARMAAMHAAGFVEASGGWAADGVLEEADPDDDGLGVWELDQSFP